MIFRFATMQDKSIKGSPGEGQIDAYCRKVTLVWCAFFIFNGGIAAWTIFSGSDMLWSVYNGGISYILTGMLFAGEFIVRKMVQKKIPKAVKGPECAGFDAIDQEKLIEKTEKSVQVEFSLPDTCPYFDGHFPEFLILPAVAQIDLITRFAAKYLGTGIGLSEIRRIKFSTFIRPFAPLLLNFEKKDSTISFKITSPNGETIYSLGSFKLMGES
jgi:3-hydroxymyristoyl/3-hydroxydecanoyl-(acyl carrier protein) dehydratase